MVFGNMLEIQILTEINQFIIKNFKVLLIDKKIIITKCEKSRTKIYLLKSVS